MNISKTLAKEIALYIVVGVGGVLVDAFTFWLALRFGAPTIFAQWLAAFAGSTHNFIWHYKLVFTHNQSMGKTYIYSTVMTGLIVILSGPLLLFVQSILENIWISKIVVIATTALFAYLIRKLYIFRQTYPIT